MDHSEAIDLLSTLVPPANREGDPAVEKEWRKRQEAVRARFSLVREGPLLELHNARLSGLNLRSLNLEGIDFRGSDFSGSRLGGAHLGGAHLNGCMIRGVTGFSSAEMMGADLRGATDAFFSDLYFVDDERQPAALLDEAQLRERDHGVHRLTVTVQSETGLHARPASKVVHAATRYECDLVLGMALGSEVWVANARTMLGVLSLAPSPGTPIKIHARGLEAERAAAAVADVLTQTSEV